MRILLVTGIFPPEIGGVASAMAEAAKELRASGHEILVVTYGDPSADAGVVRVSRSGTVVARYLRMLRTIRRLSTADTIVLTTDVFSVGIPARAAVMGRRNRFFVRLGGEWAWETAVERGRFAGTLRAYWQRPGGMRRLFEEQLYRWILGRAERVFATSRLLHAVLGKCAPRTPWTIVPNPAPMIPSALATRVAEVARPHHPRRFLYVGRFARVKNVPFLATVLRALAARGVPFQMTFVGEGETRAETERLLQGVDQVAFVGASARARVLERLADADVLLLPSLTDVCPNVVAEAHALGIPVVMTAEHGLPEGVLGMLELPPTDAEAWTVALARLATHDDAMKAFAAQVRPPSDAAQTFAQAVLASLQLLP